MSPRQSTTALHRLAQVALGVAAAVFAWSVTVAVRTTPMGADAGPAVLRDTAARPGAATPATATDRDIARAVAHDLFHASRSAPAHRYPGAASDAEPLPYADDDLAASSGVVILPLVQGTAVGATGDGFAMCAMPGAPVAVVRVGDTVGDFTVVHIERERVTFRDATGRRHVVAANASSAGADI